MFILPPGNERLYSKIQFAALQPQAEITSLVFQLNSMPTGRRLITNDFLGANEVRAPDMVAAFLD